MPTDDLMRHARLNSGSCSSRAIRGSQGRGFRCQVATASCSTREPAGVARTCLLGIALLLIAGFLAVFGRPERGRTPGVDSMPVEYAAQVCLAAVGGPGGVSIIGLGFETWIDGENFCTQRGPLVQRRYTVPLAQPGSLEVKLTRDTAPTWVGQLDSGEQRRIVIGRWKSEAEAVRIAERLLEASAAAKS